jgi:hypothetical protein
MSMESISTLSGADDVFVLRQLEDGRLFNLDGFGRGSGWAGNISVALDEEPILHRALQGELVQRQSGVPFRVFGPYWSSAVAAVPVEDGVVVFGGGQVAACDTADLFSLAAEASLTICSVPSDKGEADEAELKQAVELLEMMDECTIAKAGAEIASLAARSLSCEFGAVMLNGDPARLYLADEGWRPEGTHDEIIAALLPLQQAASERMLVEQDLRKSPFPYRPLSIEDGLVARCVVPLGPRGQLGILVVAHASSSSRGFTSLCQRVASSIGVAAGHKLGVMARD